MDFSAIEKLLDPYNQGACPGCAAIVTLKQTPIFSCAFGYADLESKTAVTLDTNFRLASITKQFTAVAAILLIQQQKLSLNQTLVEFFPTFPEYGRDISIYHLLTHTSGLIDYEDLIQEDSAQVHDDKVLELMQGQTKGYFSPGTSYRYSNGGYCLLRLIIEKATARSFAEYMRTEIFLPLGMVNTYVNEEGETNIPNRAYGYSYKDGFPIKTDQNATSATIGDGGIYSSAIDMAKWDRVFYTDILLTGESRSEFHKRRVLSDEEDGSSYGFGLFIKEYKGHQTLSHGGSSIGFRTGFLTVPDKELSVIFLSNRSGGDGSKTVQTIADIVISQLA